MNKEAEEEIISRFKERVPHACPMCLHGRHFGIINGFLDMTLGKILPNVVLRPISLPSMAVVCLSCGYVLDHLLEGLNLSLDTLKTLGVQIEENENE